MKRTKIALLIFLITALLYLLTLSPSLGYGSAVSWAVNSLLAGLPQAPGSLLYILVALLFSSIYTAVLIPAMKLVTGLVNTFTTLALNPNFEPATGVNIVSALSMAALAALSFTLLDRLISRLSERRKEKTGAGVRWIIGAGTIFAATLPSVWTSAITAGPESFDLFVLAFSLWLLVRIEERHPAGGVMMLGWAYLLGISFSERHVFLFSIAFLTAFLFLGSEVRRELRDRWLSMFGLFVLGLTIYLYISIRPILDPGLGHQVGLFKADFWRYLFNTASLRESLPRKAGFFLYQIPLFWSYFKTQGGHWICGAVSLAFLLYGLVRLFQKDRKLFSWTLALLAFSALATLWLINPKLGLEQAWDKFQDPLSHEPRNLDHLFLFSFLLAGFAVVAGLVFLKEDLAVLFARIARKMEFQTERFLRATGGAVVLVLVIAQLAYIPFRWQAVDMSGYYVSRDLAENILKGVDLEGILILRNDDEFYPALYVNKFISPQPWRSILNYYLLDNSTYLKDLKKAAPPVQFTYEESHLDRLVPVKLSQAEPVELGNLRITYPQNTIFLVRDIAVLDILRGNRFRRPVYFSGRLGEENMVGLNRYLVRQGLTVQLLERDTTVTADSLNFWRRNPRDIALDLDKSSRLLWMEYGYHTTVKDIKAQQVDKVFGLLAYARSHVELGEAFLFRKKNELATLNFRQCEFFDPQYKDMLFNLAARFAKAKDYKKTKEFANQYFQYRPPDQMKWAGLAKIALENADSVAATELLLESTKVDPDFQLGFQKLIRLHDALGNKEMGMALMSTWLQRHPNDEATRKLWEEYTTTKTLPPNFPE